MVGVATGADERRIADTSGKFAAGAPGGGGGEEASLVIERNGTAMGLTEALAKERAQIRLL